jgi:hypothetical protein
MQVLIIFSYGMTKCGSTLAFQLARTVLEANGFDQPRLSERALGNNRKINFAQHITDDMAELILRETQAIGHPIVIKTHTSLDPAVRRLFDQGHAIGHATYRDPRDMALSMLDAGKATQTNGTAAFSEITDLTAAMHAVRNQTAKLAEWLSLPNMLPLCYDDIAFDTAATAQRMLTQFALTGDTATIAAKAKSTRFTQFNKGIRDRYKTELSAEDSTAIANEFAPFIETLITNRAHLTLPLTTPLTNPQLHPVITV